MFAKRFFYVCAGLFLLALSYHLGARNATAQAPGNPVVAASQMSGAEPVAIAANGDAYYLHPGGYWAQLPNVFGSGPTPVQRESFGAMKSRYRGERGAARPATEDR